MIEKFKSYSRYLLILVFVFLAFSLAKNLLKVYDIRKSIEKEKEKVIKLRQEQERLKSETAKLQGSEFIEKQLRDKLGLAKPGEIVLVLPDEDVLRKLAPQIPQEEETLPDPNWRRWFKLFF